jgi:hypothetical protein
MRHRALHFVLMACLLSAPLSAQGSVAAGASSGNAAATAEVRRAVLDYVEGFYEGDSTKLMRSIRPEVYKFGYYIPRDSSRYAGEQMTWPEFLSYARSVKARNRPVPADAPKGIDIYDVLDQTASAKLTASWGIDYLLLAKFDGKWMITHVLWQSPPRR